MHKFVRNLLTEWRKLQLPFSNAAVVVAVSGGADSVSLLLALNDLKKRGKLDVRIVAAHFNHQLRGDEAGRDEDFVKHLAREYSLELAVGKGEVSRKGNLEQNARIARYDFLSKTAQNLNAYAILTGHTLNDQAETFLLNLLRGSGIEGLGGMRAIRQLERESEKVGKRGGEISPSFSPSPLLPFSRSFLVRPLLNWARRGDTENFCRENGVEFRYDTMNEDLSFKRVRIRKILIPMLEDFNPNIVETLANTARLLQHRPETISTEKSPADTEDFANIKDLKALEQGELYQWLRAWLRRHRGNLRSVELKHIEAIASLIQSRKSGRTVELPGGSRIDKHDGKLVFRNIKVSELFRNAL